MDNSFGVVLVMTTEVDRKRAEILAKIILQNRLAACVSMKSIESHYWWKDQLEKSDEIQLLIKTKHGLLKDLCKLIEDNHSYVTPEIISWMANPSKDYEEWLSNVVRSL